MTFEASVRRAGFTGEGLALGESLFDGILAGHHGVTFSVDEWADVSPRVQTDDGLIHVYIEEMVDELRSLADDPEITSTEFPLVLSAGERRSFTANTIIRDSSWRKRDADGALRVSVEDAAACGVVDGGMALISTQRGSARVSVEVSPMMQPGHVSLPNGMGLDEPTAEGAPRAGVAPNELTSGADRDWIAGTPWHKSVPARLEPVS
jgi:anaerobic selenocysteine-containing dehydrogenase